MQRIVYEFTGGRYHNMRMPLEAVKAIGNGEFTPDYSDARDSGVTGVPMEILDKQPVVDGYCGPMYDGTRKCPYHKDQYAVLRYESYDAYELLSL